MSVSEILVGKFLEPDEIPFETRRAGVAWRIPFELGHDCHTVGSPPARSVSRLELLGHSVNPRCATPPGRLPRSTRYDTPVGGRHGLKVPAARVARPSISPPARGSHKYHKSRSGRITHPRNTPVIIITGVLREFVIRPDLDLS